MTTLLHLFDLDGTLISSYMDRPDRDYHAWELLPGRREALAALLAEGHAVALITNQGGVGAGYNTLEDAQQKIKAVAGALGFPMVALHQFAGDARGTRITTSAYGSPAQITKRELDVFVCYAGPNSAGPMGGRERERRKPSGAMIREAQCTFGLGTVPDPNAPDEDDLQLVELPTIYVGDRPEDEAAARDAGVAFRWAHEFFGD